jgi:hypothetical protein
MVLKTYNPYFRTVITNAKNVATGMYIYELRTDKFVSVKKMVLMK